MQFSFEYGLECKEHTEFSNEVNAVKGAIGQRSEGMSWSGRIRPTRRKLKLLFFKMNMYYKK